MVRERILVTKFDSSTGAHRKWQRWAMGIVMRGSGVVSAAAAAISLAAVAQSADLVVQSVVAPPSTAAPGKPFNTGDTTANTGVSASAKSTNRYYLSREAVRSDESILLGGKRSVPALKAGRSSSGRVKVTAPSTTPPGRYYVIACADDLTQVAETNEANNCAASATQVSFPAYVQSDLTGKWGLNNIATGPGAPWWIRGLLTIATSGKAVGTLTENDGGTDPISTNMPVDSDGRVSIGGSEFHAFWMDAGKSVMATTGTWDSWMAGTTELIVMTKMATSYAQADLTGNWAMVVFGVGPVSPYWSRGPYTIAADGTAGGTLTEISGSPDPFSLKLAVQRDGRITSPAPHMECRLDAHKSFFACTNTWDDGTATMSLAVKLGTAYTQSDMVGTWDQAMLGDGACAPYWQRAVLTVDTAGHAVGDTMDNHGVPGNTDVHMVLADDGAISISELPRAACWLDSGKTIAVCSDADGSGSSYLFIMTKNRAPHEL